MYDAYGGVGCFAYVTWRGSRLFAYVSWQGLGYLYKLTEGSIYANSYERFERVGLKNIYSLSARIQTSEEYNFTYNTR